jgi:hypothetical protein
VQAMEDLVEQPLTRPASVASVDRLPLAVARGHVAPVGARVEDPEDAVEDGAVVGPPATAMLTREQVLDAFVAVVGHLVATARSPINATSGAAPILRHRGLLAGDQHRSPRAVAQPLTRRTTDPSNRT